MMCQWAVLKLYCFGQTGSIPHSIYIRSISQETPYIYLHWLPNILRHVVVHIKCFLSVSSTSTDYHAFKDEVCNGLRSILMTTYKIVFQNSFTETRIRILIFALSHMNLACIEASAQIMVKLIKPFIKFHIRKPYNHRIWWQHFLKQLI